MHNLNKYDIYDKGSFLCTFLTRLLFLNKTTGWNHYRITQDYRNMEFTSNTECEKHKDMATFLQILLGQNFFIS